jgi:para-nitrobenzyl esterase
LKISLHGALAIAIVGIAIPAARAADPVVKVTGGQIQGRLVPSGGAVFKGVPFAQPPVGNLRWRDPAPVKPWDGVRDGGTFGPACTQQIMEWNKQEAQGNQEDCLYLNVWTPEWPFKGRKPVMVWLHGGGNTGGAASVDYFDGTSLSRRGVVVVTINYRLGLFGFFAHPGLTAESPHHSSGNYGLLDQLAALKWVRDNIARLGGDPQNVTLFGQSAGSIDTSYQVASPLSKGLIHRAIQESGPPIRETPPLNLAEQSGVKFAESLKAPADQAGIRFLRSLPAADLQKAAVAARGSEGPQMGPVVDGWFLPRYPALIYRDAQEAAIPIIVGNNAREQGAPASLEAFRKGIADNFGSLAPKAEAFYGLANGGKGNDDPLYGSAGLQFTADTRYRCGAVAEAIWRSANGRTTYEYQFDRPIAGASATRHSAEVPFVFGNLLPGGFLGGPFNDTDRKISDQIQRYWTNFAKTGDPNGEGLPEWPKFVPKTRSYLEFTADGPVARQSLRLEICNLYIEALKETIPNK